MARSDAVRTRAISLLGGALLALIGGCGGGDGGGTGGGGGPVTVCGESMRKEWLYGVTRDWYLFPDTLPASARPDAYATAEELLDAMTATAREQGKDRFFSYLTTPAEENSLFGEGQFVGFGFRVRTETTDRPFVLDVFEASPALEVGMQRGDEIVAIDQGSGFVPVSQSVNATTTITDLLGPADSGVRRGLRLQRGATTFDVQMTKRVVTIDPVPDGFGAKVLPLAGTTGVGYLHLRSYISTADAQLREAFATFRAQNLQYFIVDLRYNGGGLISTSALMDDLFGGDRGTGDVQFRLEHNPSKASQNSTTRFQPTAQSTSPVRIAFLTTGATASASELNVNAMKPWVEVAIVGSDTLGKPVGQLAFDLSGCQDRLRLVAFRTVNSLGQGDYYNGLAPTLQFACAAEDTVTAPLGDPADGLTAAALGWLGSGACSSVISTGPDAAAKTQRARDSGYPLSRHPSAAEHWVPGIQ